MKARSSINKKHPSIVPLDFVKSKDEIRQSLLNFNSDPATNKNREEKLLRQTWYWVFDKKNRIFGPSKFVGFRDMNFSKYEAAIEGQWEGDEFQGNATRKAIERVLEQKFTPDPKLTLDLEDWGARLCHEDVFNGVNRDKWKFITL